MLFVLIWPLLGLLLFAFLPWRIALPLWLIVLGLSLFSSWRKMRSQKKMPPVIGKKAMIGDRAVVKQIVEQKVEVDYKGELWQSVSDVPLSPGQEVIIVRVEGLVLHVVPASRGPEGIQRIDALVKKS